jgi:hypothetical protein
VGLASFHVDLDELGHGVVELNGQDVADQIAELQLVTRPGQPTVILVRQAVGAIDLEGEGIVRVIDDTDAGPDVGELVADWVGQLDPGVVEQIVLASFADVSPPATNGEAWIRAIQQLARGAA